VTRAVLLFAAGVIGLAGLLVALGGMAARALGDMIPDWWRP
jgi:hypothetical protein